MVKVFEQAAPQPAVIEEEFAKAQQIINDPEYAKTYFLEGKEIGQVSGIVANIINKTYWDFSGCTAEEIRTLIYEYFCADGAMSKVSTYKGTGPFWKWAKVCAMHYIFKFYDNLGYRRPRKVTKGNSRLRIARLPVEVKAYIVDIVDVPELNEILWNHYVEDMNIETLCKKMDYEPAECIIALELAKETLHQAIIGTGDQDLIRTALWTSVPPPTVSLDNVNYAESGDETSPTTQIFRTAIKDIFDIDYRDPKYLLKLVDLVHEASVRMKPEKCRCKNWDRDAEIWLTRFFDGATAKELAEKYKMKSSNVDVIKSRFDARFRKYFKKLLKSYLKEL